MDSSLSPSCAYCGFSEDRNCAAFLGPSRCVALEYALFHDGTTVSRLSSLHTSVTWLSKGLADLQHQIDPWRDHGRLCTMIESSDSPHGPRVGRFPECSIAVWPLCCTERLCTTRKHVPAGVKSSCSLLKWCGCLSNNDRRGVRPAPTVEEAFLLPHGWRSVTTGREAATSGCARDLHNPAGALHAGTSCTLALQQRTRALFYTAQHVDHPFLPRAIGAPVLDGLEEDAYRLPLRRASAGHMPQELSLGAVFHI